MTADNITSHRVQPEEISDWLTVGATIGAACLWFWRNAILRFFRYVRNWFKLPSNVSNLLTTVNQMQSLLSTNESRVRATWQTIDRPIFESDANGMCVFANRCMLYVLGKQELDILGNNWRSIIHQPDRDGVFTEWDQAIKQGREFNYRYHWLGHNDDLIAIHCRTSRLTDSRGATTGWVAFIEVESPVSPPKTTKKL